MNNYEKVYKKLQKLYTDEEIAEGFMIPESLTDDELKESDKALLKHRMERMANRTEEQRLIAELARLRIRISKYLKSNLFMEEYSFGKILSEYIGIIGRSQKDFAEDIDLHPSKLSRILNNKEEPNISLMYRLEKHSDEIITALQWWKLMIRKQAHLLEKNNIQRKLESKKVRNYLKFSA